MEKNLKKDSSYLQGEYSDGYDKISSTLKLGVIQRSFKTEVEEDILEMFLRNQNNNVDFDEVVGGDLEGFIREIIDVYLDETPTKTKVLNSISYGLIVAAVFLGLETITYGKATMAYIALSGLAVIMVSTVVLLSYKISKKFNPKSTTFIAAVMGFSLSYISDFICKKVAFFNSLLKYEINTIIVMGIITMLVIIGAVIIKEINKPNFKES